MIQPYYQDESVTIYHGDCRRILPQLSSCDLILTDMPYGVTSCEWDEKLDLSLLWQLFKMVCKGAYIFTATQPFATDLINSNRRDFRFDDVWVKPPTCMMLKDRPLRSHEYILVFGKHKFNPQPFDAAYLHRKIGGVKKLNGIAPHNTYGLSGYQRDTWTETGERFPRSVFYFGRKKNNQFTKDNQRHPTEKPIELMRYLVATFSNAVDVILDPFAGVGTTLLAAKELGRRAVGIEINETYCEIAAKRLRTVQAMLPTEEAI